MMSAADAIEMLRTTRQQAQQWRDLLWQSVLDDLAKRDPDAAAAARAAAREGPTRALYGASTYEAVRAWRYLDAKARLDWIWVCRFVNQTSIQSMQTALEASA